MQTFLPRADFHRSAALLDYRRLGKQRVEVLQLLNALTGGVWSNHPAAKMWAGYAPALCVYGLAMCSRWVGMGFKDTCAGKIQSLMDELGGEVVLPLWVGDPAFHASHRSNLLRKDSVFYGKFGWLEPHDLPYVWPKGDSQ